MTLNQVINTAGNAQVVSPLTFLEASTPGSGGFIETPQQRLQVRHLLEKLTDPAEVAKVPVEGAGNLTLGDVAQIKVDHQPLIGDAVVNGGPGLIMVVEKFPEPTPPRSPKASRMLSRRFALGSPGSTPTRRGSHHPITWGRRQTTSASRLPSVPGYCSSRCSHCASTGAR